MWAAASRPSIPSSWPRRRIRIVDEDRRKTWPVNSYSTKGERRTDWFVKGVLKYHRTLGTTLDTLIDAGFVLRRVEEFAPTRKQLEQSPELTEEIERPMMLLISARKREPR